eukprot:6175797-Amphidinium_carterae.1
MAKRQQEKHEQAELCRRSLRCSPERFARSGLIRLLKQQQIPMHQLPARLSALINRPPSIFLERPTLLQDRNAL